MTIHEAAQRAFFSEVERLVAQDATAVDARDDAGRTPLMMCVYSSPFDVASRSTIAGFLLARGAPVDARDSEGCTALQYAASRDQYFEIVLRLLEAGADANAQAIDGTTPVHRALMAPANVRLLAAKGADIDARTVAARTALHAAVEYSQFETTKTLLELGADSNATDASGGRPLMLAVQTGRPELVSLVWSSGGRISDDDGGVASLIEFARSEGQDRIAYIFEPYLEEESEL